MPTTIDRANTPNDLLHRLVRGGLPELLAAVEAEGRSLPRFVVREMERFLRCGDPEEGFAWLWCRDCDHHRIVPFSCKSRGFCPSCGGRRMAERAARWVDELFPRVAVRQWVLTIPWPRRWLLARKPKLVRGMHRIAMKEVFAFYRRKLIRSAGKRSQTGAVTVVQRFSSDLRLNLHFHALVLDGVYARDAKTGKLRFHRAPAITTVEVEDIVERIARKAERWLARQGFGVDDPEAVDDTYPDDALAELQAASIEGRAAVGPRAGRRDRRQQVLGGKPYALPPRCGAFNGYNLHAGVVVGARARPALERLARYVCRPPLAKPRIEESPDGGVVLHLRRPWSDGTTAIELSRLELTQRLAAQVPPPRMHQLFYTGILGRRATWRREVTPRPPRPCGQDACSREAAKLRRSGSGRSRWFPWAALLSRVFGVHAWNCPRCGQRMELRAEVVLPPATRKILAGLAAASAVPP